MRTTALLASSVALLGACATPLAKPAIDGTALHPGVYTFETQRRATKPTDDPWSTNFFYPDLIASASEARGDSPVADGPLTAAAWLYYSAYKNTLSRLDGSTCRFSPSCSSFGLEAVRRHGLFGVAMTFGRLHRNHNAHAHYPMTRPPFLDDPVANYGFWMRTPALDDFESYANPAHAWYQHVRAARALTGAATPSAGATHPSP